jgi:hypothetical protein
MLFLDLQFGIEMALLYLSGLYDLLFVSGDSNRYFSADYHRVVYLEIPIVPIVIVTG